MTTSSPSLAATLPPSGPGRPGCIQGEAKERNESLAAQLHAITRALAQDDDAPAELRAFGRVLNDILAGNHQPDLSNLPPLLFTAV